MSAISLITLGFFEENTGNGETVIHIGELEIETPEQNTVAEISENTYIITLNEQTEAKIVEYVETVTEQNNTVVEKN